MENTTARRFLNCRAPRQPPQFRLLSIPLELFQNIRTIELLRTSELDAALEKPVAYRPPSS